MKHTFDIKIAEQYGIPSAVLLDNLYFWIEKNKANDKNFYDGYYWTYNSKKAFLELFPYMTNRQIEYSLKKLIDDGLIVTGNYNKSQYDRTLWYAITKKGYCILQNCEMDNTNLSNDLIYNTNKDINKYNKQESIIKKNKEIDEFFERVWSLYPRKTNKTQIRKATKERLFKVGYEKIARCIERYKQEINAYGTQKQYIKAGSTFFNGGYEDYLDDNWQLLKSDYLSKAKHDNANLDYEQHAYSKEQLESTFIDFNDFE